jgi:hypothetical protein
VRLIDRSRVLTAASVKNKSLRSWLTSVGLTSRLFTTTTIWSVEVVKVAVTSTGWPETGFVAPGGVKNVIEPARRVPEAIPRAATESATKEQERRRDLKPIDFSLMYASETPQRAPSSQDGQNGGFPPLSDYDPRNMVELRRRINSKVVPVAIFQHACVSVQHSVRDRIGCVLL